MNSKFNANYKSILLILAVVFAVLVGTEQSVYAQDEGAAEAAEAATSNQSLIDIIKSGGWMMWPLGALSVAMVGLTLYNAFMLREKLFLRPEVVEVLKEPLETLDIEEARAICDANPCVVTNILYAGLDRVQADHLDPDAIEKAMEVSSTEEMAVPFVFINYLNVVAGVSPMVGLLGTVIGMVSAFNTIKVAGMGKPQELAGDISVALVTTASGLMIAVPALIAYFYFKNKYGRLASSVHRYLGDLYYTMMHAVQRAE